LTDENVARNDGATGTAEPATGQRPLTATERSRRHRERKRQAGKQAHGRWATAEPGNLLALRHGAASPRFVDPLSRDIVETLLADPGCPPHLHQSRYAAALASWGRAEACCRLIAAWLSGMDVTAALTATSTSAETEDHGKAQSTRRGVQRHVEGAMAALDRHERTAARLRDALGLTPAAAARMKLDAAPKYDSAVIVAALLAEDARREEGHDAG
jgi:hypothetical protein